MRYVLYVTETKQLKSWSRANIENPDPSIYTTSTANGEGTIWNEQTLEFDPIPASKKMTTLAFMELFTDAELIGILDAAKVNTQVELFVLKMKQAEEIDLNYPTTIAGIQALGAAGLLTADRVVEILNG